MLQDYEDLRQKQLEFLKGWNETFVKKARENKHHNHFSLDYGEIYALRIDDLVDFVNKNKMTFEFEHFMNEIIFSDIRRKLIVEEDNER